MTVLKYREHKEIRAKESFFMRAMSNAFENEKWQWVIKVVFIMPWLVIRGLYWIKPFKRWMRKHYGLNSMSGRMDRLIKKKKYEEGYKLGVKSLAEWLENPPKPESMAEIIYDVFWWGVLESTCVCAEEIQNEDAPKVLSILAEKGPNPKEGFLSARAFYALASLENKKKNVETAWKWIERSIECDGTWGFSHWFRAGLGVILRKGQPLDDLVACLRNQPELKEGVFSDQLFKDTPGLLEDLKARLDDKSEHGA